jgi:hypothetical protein
MCPEEGQKVSCCEQDWPEQDSFAAYRFSRTTHVILGSLFGLGSDAPHFFYSWISMIWPLCTNWIFAPRLRTELREGFFAAKAK